MRAKPGSGAARPSGARRKLSSRARGAHDQRGFALLLVFAMAAIVAITLYMQLPRVAFEAQRDRETMLVERGEQYRRAIELYVRKNNRYPARIEDLERDQDLRYLRRRYKDPMTGKDEWRLIHINAAGQLEDSLIEKPKTGAKPGETQDAGEAAAQNASAQNAAGQNVAENMALQRRRPGDETAANAQFPGSGERGAGPPPDAVSGEPPAAEEGMVPLLDAGGNVIERMKTEAQAQAQQAGIQAGAMGTPASAIPGGAGRQSAEGTAPPQRPVRLGPGGIPIIENPLAVVAGTSSGQAGVVAGQATAAPSAPAAGSGSGGGTQGQPSPRQTIEGLLMQPRPGGLAGLQQQRGIQAAGGAAGLGAGIAGVASKLEMKGILVYGEQEAINKWEFVYDARRAGAKAGGDPAQRGVRTGQPGSPAFQGGFNAPSNNPGGQRPSPDRGGFSGIGQPPSGSRGGRGMAPGGRR